jgi:hypothetical protein
VHQVCRTADLEIGTEVRETVSLAPPGCRKRASTSSDRGSDVAWSIARASRLTCGDSVGWKLGKSTCEMRCVTGCNEGARTRYSPRSFQDCSANAATLRSAGEAFRKNFRPIVACRRPRPGCQRRFTHNTSAARVLQQGSFKTGYSRQSADLRLGFRSAAVIENSRIVVTQEDL